MGQLMVIGRTVWGLKVPSLKATEASLSYVQCFLYLVSSSINVSIFHITGLDIFWTDLLCNLSPQSSIIYNSQDMKTTYLLINGWIIKKRWYTHNRILFSHKKKEILTFVTTWMNLEGVMCSDISQTIKINTTWYHLSMYHENGKPNLSS